MTKKTKKTKPAAAAKSASAAPAAAPAKVEPKAAPAAAGKTVAARAHEIWVAKGKPVPGSPLEDWLQAEREVGVRKA